MVRWTGKRQSLPAPMLVVTGDRTRKACNDVAVKLQPMARVRCLLRVLAGEVRPAELRFRRMFAPDVLLMCLE